MELSKTAEVVLKMPLGSVELTMDSALAE